MSAPVVLVHGAWHGAWCWDLVVDELAALGVSAVAVELPLTGLGADVEEVRAAVTQAGPGAVVVGHSYGGLVISLAASGSSTVGRLVYLAALMLDAGDDVGQVMADAAERASLGPRVGRWRHPGGSGAGGRAVLRGSRSRRCCARGRPAANPRNGRGFRHVHPAGVAGYAVDVRGVHRRPGAPGRRPTRHGAAGDRHR